METTNIKDLLENWDQFDAVDTEKIIREHTNNYQNLLAIRAIIKDFKNLKDGLELDIKNFSQVDEAIGKSSIWSLNYDKLGDVEFFINDKEYDEEYSFSALKKIMSKNQLGEVIDELEKKINPSTDPEPKNKNPFPLIFTGNDDKAYNVFMDFKKTITDYYPDYSFVFQKMIGKTEMLIEKKCKHREFMDWLFKNEHISQTVYNDFIDKESFSKKYDRGMRPTIYNHIKENHFPSNSD
jgi:hypothetical protein